LNEDKRKEGAKKGEKGLETGDEGDSKRKSLSGAFIDGAAECSKWIYYAIIFLLVGFLIAQFIVQMQTNYLNTQRFIQNLNALKFSYSNALKGKSDLSSTFISIPIRQSSINI
jgi:hypothetical protein